MNGSVPSESLGAEDHSGGLHMAKKSLKKGKKLKGTRTLAAKLVHDR
jgi:hypothetical protein